MLTDIPKFDVLLIDHGMFRRPFNDPAGHRRDIGPRPGHRL